MAINSYLKPFYFNLSDLTFILDQLNFRPLFDADGNAIVNWDGTGAVHDASGALLADLGSAGANIGAYGTSYSSTTAAQGLRDVTGYNNNLLLVHADWGAVDQPFWRTIPADFTSYLQPLSSGDTGAFYGTNFSTPMNPDYQITGTTAGGVTTITNQQNAVDYTPRMISLTVTTGGVTFETDVNGHIVHDADGKAVVQNYGLLETLGQQDKQNPDNAEFFIGQENPGVAPSNGWFALFGQFFDHGLDFIEKGGQGIKITIPLAATDPLFGVIGPDGKPATSITINRATISSFDSNGDPEYVNHTSPYIDQSQTYGSHAQMTSLLREWVVDPVSGTYHAGMNLFDGTTLDTAWTNAFGELTTRTLPTLNELRSHILETGRDDITWEDVTNLRNRDANGDVAAGADAGTTGQALLLDMNPRFDAGHLNPDDNDAATTWDALITANVDAAIATLTADVASIGVVGLTFGWDAGHTTLELVIPPPGFGPDAPAGTYTGASALALWVNFSDFSITATNPAVHAAVGEVLMAAVGDHYIAGDGRVNENFGLTTIHHVFHEEHNFQIRNLQDHIHMQDAASGDATHQFLHEWQVAVSDGIGGFYTNAAGDYTDAAGNISWDQDKMFNAAKLVVEMEYQHAAVDQYARTVTPDIPEFVGYNSGVNSTISLEYAQGAFRFGHSTLRETIDTIDPTGGITGQVMSFALEQAFLNPGQFAASGPAAIALGMSHQQMNEIDEFITPALNQGLLGLPLDLASINIARGRDIGLPALNDFREAIGFARYYSWVDFGSNMIHPESLVNFIAAYSLDGDVATAQAIVSAEAGDATALMAILSVTEEAAINYAIDFLNGGDTGFNRIDTWIGGLAEAHVTGGLLGETFNAVFVDQIIRLMDGDRFYYLFRLVNQQFGEEVNNGQFKDIVERNTGLTHLNGSVFAYADQYYDLARNVDAGNAKTEHKYGEIIAANTAANGGDGVGIWSDGGSSTSTNGVIITFGGQQYVRDIRTILTGAAATAYRITGENLDGTPDSGANAHEVIVGSENDDYIHARGGDDTVYGDAGDDIIYGDAGIDRLYGGDGNDTIWGGDGPDLVDGGGGDDIIYGESSGTAQAGVDQLIGGEGDDLITGGIGIDKLSGGRGDDRIFGDSDTDPFTHAGDGQDFIDGGSSGDNLYGDNGDDLVVGADDQDIIFGGDGDDILRPGNPSTALGGGPDEVLGGDGYTDTGFDLIDFSDYAASKTGVAADLTLQQNPLIAIDQNTGFPAWFQIEGVIGSQNDDTILGNDTIVADDELGNVNGDNWMIGGSGSDTFQGKGGNDVIIGGSIRLDTLIGTYAGSYDNKVDGASHRAVGNIQNNGLLDAVELGGAFEKHFTEYLSSNMFKDHVLGDINGLDAGTTIDVYNYLTGLTTTQTVGASKDGTDTAVFQGNRFDYTVSAIDFMLPDGSETITAIKIVDNGGLLADGVTVRTALDGTDLVTGIENFRFADGDLSIIELFNLPPVIAGGAVEAVAVDENQVLAAIVSAADPNNTLGDPLNPQEITFSISGGVDAALFDINSLTGELTFKSAPNFELPAHVNNAYEVIVKAADPLGASDTQTITVSVKNVDEVSTGELHITGYSFNGNTSANITALNTIADGDLVTAGNPAGALTGVNPPAAQVAAYQWQRFTAGNWVNIAGATASTLANQANSTVRVTSRYTDAFSTSSFVSSETAFVTGSGGNNSILGSLGTDFVLGLGGNDTLTGGAGNDTVDGGAGTDRLVATAGDGNDSYIGGAGTDTYDLAGTLADAIIDLAAGTATSAETGTDTLQGIENVRGSQGMNTITGSSANNRLDGLGGNDWLKGGAGGDTLNGGEGADTLVADADNTRDNLDGGAGIDTADFSAFSANLNVSLEGNDQVTVTGSGTGNGSDRIRNIENFIGGSGNDSITGDNNVNRLEGGAGNDTLNGRGGSDFLVGGAGNDTFNVGQGHDTIVFKDGFGDDRALSFDADGGAGAQDIIDVSQLGLHASDLGGAITWSLSGADLLITLSDDGTLRLVNYVGADIGASDFLFAV